MLGARIGIECNVQFFGFNHTVFSTDFPFAPRAETTEAVSSLDLERKDLEIIC